MANVTEFQNFNVEGEHSYSELINYLAKVTKQLNYMFSNLDSLNVKSINTALTTVTSGDGATIIDGPVIKMYDDTPTLRLQMGYNGTNFVFELYNSSGEATLTTDSNGNATLKGLVRIAYVDDEVRIGGSEGIQWDTDDINEGLIYSSAGIFVAQAVNILKLQSGNGSDILLASDNDVNILTNDFKINSTAGLSGTYTFGGGSSGNVSTMTFTKGILTGVTLVP